MVNDELWSKIEAVDRPGATRAEIAKLHENLVSKSPAEPKLLYRAARLWFDHIARKRGEGPRPQVVDPLAKLLHEDSTPGLVDLARLYLGYEYFGSGRFNEAIEQFELLEPTELDPREQLVRRELMLCSKIRLDGLNKHLDGLEEYATLARRWNEWDLRTSLEHTLRATAEELSDNAIAILKRLAPDLDKGLGMPEEGIHDTPFQNFVDELG